ncbi:MAG: hypothetical protein WCQ95_09590 [Bacteroidota bacterium]
MVKRMVSLYRSFFFFSAMLLLPMLGSTQKSYEASGDPKIAKQFFSFGDYFTALKEYQYLYILDTTKTEYCYPLGVCYLHTNIDKTKSIPLLEKVVAQKDFDAEAMYQLGAAYQSSCRFDEAIVCFNKYKTLSEGKDKNSIPLERCIEMCKNGIELVQHPINVTFENLGSKINSPSPDFNPFVNKNETMLFYTSQRSSNNGGMLDFDGYFTADVFASENNYGEWEKGRRLAPTFNSAMNEETVGLAADASQLFVFVDNFSAKMQTMVSYREGKSFQSLTALGSTINPSGKGATSVSVTPDKKTIFFASAKDGGEGGSDIYMSNLLPSGQWGPVKNLGKTINTKYNEDYPFIAPDGKTLYFASEGHNSMGGFDIFRSEWNAAENTFSEPVNIGYPLNTPDDNTTISFTGSGRYAYISALRKDSYGNLDIYRVTFNDINPGYTTLVSNLVEKDSVDIYKIFYKKLTTRIDSLEKATDTAAVAKNSTPQLQVTALKAKLQLLTEKLQSGPEVKITVQSATNLALVGNYKPNKQSGKFIVILTPGEYVVTIHCEGYQELKENVIIINREMPIKEITKSFRLTSI